MNSVATRVADLWHQNQVGSQKPDIAGFVDQIVLLAEACSWIAGRSTSDDTVLFSAGDRSESEIRVTRAKVGCRWICARLGTFMSEHSEKYKMSPHHGEHAIYVKTSNDIQLNLQISYVNTPSEQKFKIESIGGQKNGEHFRCRRDI